MNLSVVQEVAAALSAVEKRTQALKDIQGLISDPVAYNTERNVFEYDAHAIRLMKRLIEDALK